MESVGECAGKTASKGNRQSCSLRTKRSIFPILSPSPAAGRIRFGKTGMMFWCLAAAPKLGAAGTFVGN